MQVKKYTCIYMYASHILVYIYKAIFNLLWIHNIYNVPYPSIVAVVNIKGK